MYDVISLGTATLDVFLRSSGMEVVGQNGEKEICLRYGAKLEVDEIHFETGGGGTNSAVTFARQGLKTGVVVQIGRDFAGEKVLQDLKNEQVETSLIDIKEGMFTDYSTVLWAEEGGRTILVYRGKTRLEVSDVNWGQLQTRWFYVSSLEGNLEIVERLESLDGKISWNPGGRELAQREAVWQLLPKITVLNLNKEEMEELLGRGVGEMNDLLKGAQELPCEYVVITDDRRGAYLWDRAGLTWWKCGIFEETQKVEATGAGDAFGSGLVSGLIQGRSLDECLWLASANASSVVSQVGAKKGILCQEDLKNWPREKLKIEKVAF